MKQACSKIKRYVGNIHVFLHFAEKKNENKVKVNKQQIKQV